MKGLQSAARVQTRVIWALMLRETKTLFGKHKLGYMWALINAAFSIGIFWAIRDFGGFLAPHGHVHAGVPGWRIYSLVSVCRNGHQRNEFG